MPVARVEEHIQAVAKFRNERSHLPVELLLLAPNPPKPVDCVLLLLEPKPPKPPPKDILKLSDGLRVRGLWQAERCAQRNSGARVGLIRKRADVVRWRDRRC